MGNVNRILPKYQQGVVNFLKASGMFPSSENMYPYAGTPNTVLSVSTAEPDCSQPGVRECYLQRTGPGEGAETRLLSKYMTHCTYPTMAPTRGICMLIS